MTGSAGRARRAQLVTAAAAIALAAGAAPAGAAAPSFGAPVVSENLGNVPDGTTVGDVNRDGRPDLVVSDRSVGHVWRLLGNGDGTLTRLPSVINVALGTNGVRLADYDRDGRLDYFFTGLPSQPWMRGDGSGGATLGGAIAFAGSVRSRPPVVADLDGDGDQELAYAAGDQLGVVGLGGGSAVTQTTIGGSTDAIDLIAGDFDRDGDVDLHVLSGDTAIPRFLWNDGSGIFPAGGVFDVNVGANSASALADFNRDGVEDIVQENDDDLAIVRMRADGRAAFSNGATTSGPPSEVTTGDFDRDGDTDVAALVPGGVDVLVNDGTGYFPDGDRLHVPHAGDLAGLAVADFTADGLLDVAFAERDVPNADGAVVVLPNTTAVARPNAFRARARHALGTGANRTTVGDLNRDGIDDVVVTEDNGNTASVLLGDGADGFATRIELRTGGSGPVDPAIGDVDGDGRLDLVVANFASSNIGVLRGDGAGGFAPAVGHSSPNGGERVVLGDVDRDGDLDAVTFKFLGEQVAVHFNDGSGGFATQQLRATSGQISDLEVADFDRDGNLDIATAPRTGDQVNVLLGNGTGSFAAPIVTPVAAGLWGGIVSDDLDRDGDADLVLTRSGNGAIAVLLNDGFGDFDAGATIAHNGYAMGLAIGELDGDGVPDLVVPDHDAFYRYRGLGDGTFAAPVVRHVGTTPRQAAIGDFGRDGIADVAIPLRNARELAVFSGVADHAAPTTGDDVDTAWTRAPAPVTLTADDGAEGSGVAATRYEIGRMPATPTAASPLYDAAAPPTLAHGERIAYFSVDHAGNAEAVKTSDAARVDGDAPAAPTLVSGPDARTTAREATIAFSGEDDAVFACTVDGGAAAPCDSPLALSALALGEHAVAVTQTDPAGNASDPLEVAWTVVEPEPEPEPRREPEPQPEPRREPQPEPRAEPQPIAVSAALETRGRLLIAGKTTVRCAAAGPQLTGCRVEARAYRPIVLPGTRAAAAAAAAAARGTGAPPAAGRAAGASDGARAAQTAGRTLPAGTVLAVGELRGAAAAAQLTVRLRLTADGRAALRNRPLGRTVVLAPAATAAGGELLVPAAHTGLRLLASDRLVVRKAGRGVTPTAQMRAILDRLAPMLTPASKVRCVADVDRRGGRGGGASAREADRLLTVEQATRACDHLRARGFRGTLSTQGNGSARAGRRQMTFVVTV